VSHFDGDLSALEYERAVFARVFLDLLDFLALEELVISFDKSKPSLTFGSGEPSSSASIITFCKTGLLSTDFIWLLQSRMFLSFSSYFASSGKS